MSLINLLLIYHFCKNYINNDFVGSGTIWVVDGSNTVHMMVGFDMEAINDANNGNQIHERLMQISGCHHIQFIDCLQIDFWSCCFHFVLP